MRKAAVVLITLIIITNVKALTRDITLAINDEEQWEKGVFTITNADHETGRRENILVNLTYHVRLNNQTITHGTSTHVINKYTRTGTGILIINTTSEGVMSICGSITSNITDPNTTNNHGCWHYTVVNATTRFLPELTIPSREEENTTLPSTSSHDSSHCDEFMIRGVPRISNNNEQLTYSFTPWREGDEVTYWVEDVFGNTLKQPVTTKRKTKKTYTPRITGREQTIIIKAVRTRKGCDDAVNETIITIRGEPEETITEQGLELLEGTTAEARFGESILVAVRVMMNTNRRRNIDIKLMKENTVLQRAKLTLEKKGTYELIIPLPLPADEACDWPDDTYTLMVKGVGVEEEQPVFLSHETCKEQPPIIRSFFTRAQNYQETIKAYAVIDHDTKALLIRGEAQLTNLTPGTNTLILHPRPGKNTYALLIEKNNTITGRLLTFSLREKTRKEKEQQADNKRQTTETRTQSTGNRTQMTDAGQQSTEHRTRTTDGRTLNPEARPQTTDLRQQPSERRPLTSAAATPIKSSYTFTPLTGSVMYEEDEEQRFTKTITTSIGAMIITGVWIAMMKRKDLRSKKTHEQLP